MQTVVLAIHLILALALIGVVLMQRSEGGGLGIGGGGGGGAMTGRSAANAMTKLTWILATAFIITSITLTIIAAQNNSGTSVIDSVTAPATGDGDAQLPSLLGDDLLPPTAEDAPAAPPKAE